MNSSWFTKNKILYIWIILQQNLFKLESNILNPNHSVHACMLTFINWCIWFNLNFLDVTYLSYNINQTLVDRPQRFAYPVLRDLFSINIQITCHSLYPKMQKICKSLYIEDLIRLPPKNVKCHDQSRRNKHQENAKKQTKIS